MNEHFKRSAGVDPSWSDTDAAVRFLQLLRPTGPWVLSASYPSDKSPRIVGDVGPIPTKSFSDVAKARAWIDARSGKANLYYTVNLTGVVSSKPSKRDVLGVEFLHVDIDADEDGPLAADSARKRAVVERLRAFDDPGPPSFIIDSGGGLQALWVIGLTNTGDIAEAEASNRKLIERFGGDSGTWNIDRLLRLPGTVNLPDQKKTKRGRVPAPATLIEHGGRKYDLWMFEADDGHLSNAEVTVEIGAAEEVEDLDAFAGHYDLPERIVSIIEDGRLTKPKDGDDSRSAWLFDAICGLVRAKVPNEMILGIITDERYRISESILEKNDPEGSAERQIRSALAEVAQPSALGDDTTTEPASADWPRALRYSGGHSANNARNGRIFAEKRPGRIVTSDGVMFGLNPGGVWTEIKEAALRAEMRATNPKDTLQVHDIGQMLKAVQDLTQTGARPFDWIDPPASAPVPKDLVLFRNGMLNVSSGELLPLDGSYFATALPTFEYMPTTDCPRWLIWLDERLDPSFHPTLQEWMGYVMVPDTTAHRFATFTGPPRSGKSTSKNIIEQLVGSDHISRKQLADMGKEFGLQDAVDKRLIVIPDAKDAPGSQRGQALERILAVTGGDITGIPRKYLPAVSVKLLTRLLVLGNRQPAWIDESGALAARQIAIVFDRSFEGKEDQAIEDRLMSELPGIPTSAGLT